MRILISACLVAGCAHHSGGNDGGTAYDSILVDPPQVTLTVALGGTAAQTYQVIGVIGSDETEITSQCTLGLDSTFGSATGATVTVGPHGGTTAVTATCGAQTGASQLTVNLAGAVVIGPNTPTNAPGLFGAATPTVDPTRAPTIQYPLDQAIAPLNIPPIEVQWTASGDDLFHISLTSTYATIDLYATDLQVAIDAVDWTSIAGTAAGDTLQITVEGLLQAAPATKYASTPVGLRLSHDTIDMTAIYYWASSQGSIMTDTFGSTAPPSVVKDNCTACHSLSRAGTRLGYSRCVAGDCGAEYVGFMHYNAMTAAWDEVVDADNKTISGSYTTFAPVGNPFPSDDQSVALVTLAGGVLGLYDPDTGTPVASNLAAVALPGRSSLMPDWSADGNTVVFATTPGGNETVDVSGSSIASMTYSYANAAHTFGSPQMLVTSPITLGGMSYANLFFPSLSPDNALIVFDAARSDWRNFSVAASAGQRLALVSATGANLVDLTAINGPGDLDTTWPHWAPGQTTDYYWIVYSSERDYGHEVTAANTAPACIANGVKQCKQIWIGAIDKAKLAANPTQDPSAPPVWVPGQDTQADNISPYWTQPPPLQ